MSRKIQEPVTSKGSHNETVTRHPAYGQISVARVSGKQMLYGSDFSHNAFMKITISKSELHRNLSRDWHFGTDEIIQVSLSEAQWATFVSSPNVAAGVPCTINHVQYERMPALPAPQNRVDQFQDEVNERLKDSLEEIARVEQEIDAMALPKTKAEKLKGSLRFLRQKLRDDLPFVAECFSAHMEETVEKAKTEMHGYIAGTLQRAGLEAIRSQKVPFSLEDHSERPGDRHGEESPDDVDEADESRGPSARF